MNYLKFQFKIITKLVFRRLATAVFLQNSGIPLTILYFFAILKLVYLSQLTL